MMTPGRELYLADTSPFPQPPGSGDAPTAPPGPALPCPPASSLAASHNAPSRIPPAVPQAVPSPARVPPASLLTSCIVSPHPLCACGQQATTAATQYLEGIASLDQARGCICLTEAGHGDSTWLSAFARSRCLINALSELPTLLHLENQGSKQGSGLPSFLHPSWLSLLPPCTAPHHP